MRHAGRWHEQVERVELARLEGVVAGAEEVVAQGRHGRAAAQLLPGRTDAPASSSSSSSGQIDAAPGRTSMALVGYKGGGRRSRAAARPSGLERPRRRHRSTLSACWPSQEVEVAPRAAPPRAVHDAGPAHGPVARPTGAERAARRAPAAARWAACSARPTACTTASASSWSRTACHVAGRATGGRTISTRAASTSPPPCSSPSATAPSGSWCWATRSAARRRAGRGGAAAVRGRRGHLRHAVGRVRGGRRAGRPAAAAVPRRPRRDPAAGGVAPSSGTIAGDGRAGRAARRRPPAGQVAATSCGSGSSTGSRRCWRPPATVEPSGP